MAYQSTFLPATSSHNTESSTRLGWPIAEASELVLSFGGVALLGGLEEGMTFFFQLDTLKI